MSKIILRLQFLFPLPLQGNFDLSAFEYLNHSFMQQCIKLRRSYRVTPADVDKGITFSLKKIPHFFSVGHNDLSQGILFLQYKPEEAL